MVAQPSNARDVAEAAPRVSCDVRTHKMTSVLLKTALGFVCIVIVLFALAFTGILFRVWPTSSPDKRLEITSATVDELRALRLQSKFHANEASFYPGAPNEAVRGEAERRINSLLDRLIDGLPTNPSRAFVLANVKTALSTFNTFDSEERDRASAYMEEVMKVSGVKDSGELLNVWRYGLPYGWIRRKS
jgi:hypothetical protein